MQCNIVIENRQKLATITLLSLMLLLFVCFRSPAGIRKRLRTNNKSSKKCCGWSIGHKL